MPIYFPAADTTNYRIEANDPIFMTSEASESYSFALWVRLHENNNGVCELVTMKRAGSTKH